MDEVRNDVRNWLGRAKFAKEVPTWRRNPVAIADRAGVAIEMMNGVGGTSLHYRAGEWRLLCRRTSRSAARRSDATAPGRSRPASRSPTGP